MAAWWKDLRQYHMDLDHKGRWEQRLMNLGLRLFATGQRPTWEEIAGTNLPHHHFSMGDGAANLTMLAVASHLVRSGALAGSATNRLEERDALAWFKRQLPGGDIGIGVDQLSPYANIRLFALLMLAGYGPTEELRRVAMRLVLPALAFYLLHCDSRGRCFPPGGRVYGPPKGVTLDDYQRQPESTLTEVCQRLRGDAKIDPHAPNHPAISGYLAQVVGINREWLAEQLIRRPGSLNHMYPELNWFGGLSDPHATWTIRRYGDRFGVSWFSQSVGFAGGANGAMMVSRINTMGDGGQRMWVDGHGRVEERGKALFIFDGGREFLELHLPPGEDLTWEVKIDATGATLDGQRIAPIDTIPPWTPIEPGLAGESTPKPPVKPPVPPEPEEPKVPVILPPEEATTEILRATQRALGHAIENGTLAPGDERLIRQARGCIRKVQLNRKKDGDA